MTALGWKSTSSYALFGAFFLLFLLSVINEMSMKSTILTLIDISKRNLSILKNKMQINQNIPSDDKFNHMKPTNPPCSVSPINDVEEFFHIIRHLKFECEILREIGGRPGSNDGSKFACFDERFNFKINNCVILSFGLNGNWNFEIDMSKYGCSIHGFDPTINIKDSEKKGFKFYKLGLSDVKGEKNIGKVDKYENIINMLDLNDTIIDYLKIDIEGSEIQFFKDVFNNSLHLLKNVNQIGMEIHPGRLSASPNEIEALRSSNFGILFENIQKLECAGFRLAHSEMNRVTGNHYSFKNRTESSCYELLWIRE